METISVSVRIRPLAKNELVPPSPWKLESNTITLCSQSGIPVSGQSFSFDNVFAPQASTIEVYEAHTKEIICSTVDGFNGTVFAYGQTSSGKTFSMRGSPQHPGITPLAIYDVFNRIGQATDREFLLRVSYMEIYNEEINDLLAPENRKLQVHESAERAIFVAGLREEIVVNPDQVLQMLDAGQEKRHVGETNMNIYSSRSHTIFRMVIESREKSVTGNDNLDAVRVSTLNLVDLAGSERVGKTGAEGVRLKEGGHINKSLMTLGTVINKLADGVERTGGHVPYRDSKLTRILQPSLGGNAKTAIICCVTPAAMHADETKGTLLFATRAKRVTNCAQVNEIVTDEALLKRQKKEIEELRAKLQENHSPHLEEEVLNLRNALLQTELERERMIIELQEEKAVHEQRMKEQEQRIANLSIKMINSAVDDRNLGDKKGNRRQTWCPPRVVQLAPPNGVSGGPNCNSEALLPPRGGSRPAPFVPPFTRVAEKSENEASPGSDSSPSTFGSPVTKSSAAFTIGGRSRARQWVSSTSSVARKSESPVKIPKPFPSNTSTGHGTRKENPRPLTSGLNQEKRNGRLSSLQEEGDVTDGNEELELYISDRRARSLDSKESTIDDLRAQIRSLDLEKSFMERQLDDLADELKTQSRASYEERNELQQELQESKVAFEESQSELRMALEKVAMLEDEVAVLKEHTVCGGCKQRSLELSTEELSLNSKEEAESVKPMERDTQNKELALTARRPLEKKDENILSPQKSQLIGREDMQISESKSSGGAMMEKLDSAHEQLETQKVESDVGIKVEEAMTTVGVRKMHEEDKTRQLESENSRLLSELREARQLIERMNMKVRKEDHELQMARQDLVRSTKTGSSMLECDREGNVGPTKPDMKEKSERKTCHEFECEEVDRETLRTEASTDVHDLQRMSDEGQKTKTLSAVSGELLQLKQQLEDSRMNKDILGQEVKVVSEKLAAAMKVIHDHNLSEEDPKSNVAALEPSVEMVRLTDKVEEIETRNATLTADFEIICKQKMELEKERKLEMEARTKIDELFAQSKAEEARLQEELQSLKERVLQLRSEKYTCEQEKAKALYRLQELEAEQSDETASAQNELNVLKSATSAELTQLKQQLELLQETKETMAQDLEEERNKLENAKKEIHEYCCLLENEGEKHASALEDQDNETERLKSVIKELESKKAAVAAELDAMVEQKENLQKVNESNMEEKKQLEVLLTSSKAEETRLQEMLQTSEKQALELQVEKNEQEEEKAKILQRLELLAAENAGLTETLTSLRQGLEEEREEKRRTIAEMEERLGTLESGLVPLKQEKQMLELAVQTLEADSQAQMESYNKMLLEREEHCEKIVRELMEIEKEKGSLAKAVQELEHQLIEEKAFASDAVRNLEACRQQHLHETAQLRSELASLRKDVVSAKSMPAALAKEKDAVEKELVKIKNKLKDTEAKLKTALQERTTIQTEKANMERELKKLRQSNLLAQDINKRESVAGKKRESLAHNLTIAKRQSSTIEHRFQNKSNELEKVQFELQMLQEAHERLETAHNELQECSATLEKKLQEKEDLIGELQNSGGESSQRFQLELEKAKEELQQAEAEVTSLREEYTRLLSIAQTREETLKEASAKAAELPAVQKELHEVSQLLSKTQDIFEEKESQFIHQQMASALEKQKMVIRLAEVEETVKKLEVQVQTCTKEAKELQDQLEEEKTVKELLEQTLTELENSIAIEKEQMALENANQVNVFDARIELLSDQLQEVQKELKDTEEMAESTRKESKAKLIMMEARNRNLSEKLKEMTTHLKKMEENEKRMLEEQKEFCTANTKLEVAFEAAKSRLEVFEDRLAKADREKCYLRDKMAAIALRETSVAEMVTPDTGRSNGDAENEAAFGEIKIEDLQKEAQVLELMEENRILTEKLEKIEEQRRCAQAWKEELKRRQLAAGQQDSSELMEKKISSLMDDLQKSRRESEMEKTASSARQLQLERQMKQLEAQLKTVTAERNGLQTDVRRLSARYTYLLRSQPIEKLHNSHSLQNDSPLSERNLMHSGVLSTSAKENVNSSFTSSIPPKAARETKTDVSVSTKEANVSQHKACNKGHQGAITDIGSVTKSSHGGYNKENV